MTRHARLLTGAIALALTASPGLASGGSTLYGITTTTDGSAQVVTVDLETGAATSLFDVAILDGFGTGTMAYHAPAGLLAVLLSDGASQSRMQVIDPGGAAADSAAIVGLPDGETQTSGLEYHTGNDWLLFTFGQTNGNSENRIARVSLGGAVEDVSPDIGLGDIDVLGWSDARGVLVACDFNANDGLPPLATVSDVFGAPSWTPYANPPSNGNVGDVAIDPTSGRLFVIGFDGGGGTLIEVVGDQYVTIGAFDLGVQIVGLAFVALPCIADLNGCGSVDVNDLLLVLAAWGTNDPIADIAPPGGDGVVDVDDLLVILGAWEPCP